MRRFNVPTEYDIPVDGWRPYSEIHRERIRAHEKHDDNNGSMERKDWWSEFWLPVVIEELGEVARVLCELNLGNVRADDAKVHLREELIQTAAMVVAWVDAIDLETSVGTGADSGPDLPAQPTEGRLQGPCWHG